MLGSVAVVHACYRRVRVSHRADDVVRHPPRHSRPVSFPVVILEALIRFFLSLASAERNTPPASEGGQAARFPPSETFE